SEAPLSISAEGPLPAGQDFLWVELEGTPHFQRRAGDELLFELQDGDGSVAVRLRRNAAADLPETGGRIRARGVCRCGFNNKGEWVPVSLWASGFEELPDKRSRKVEPKAGAGAGGFTAVKNIRQMSRARLQSRPYVKVRGVITSLLGMYLQDDTAAIQVVFDANAIRAITQLGTYVELEGQAGLSDAEAPLISVNRVLVLAHGALPNPR